MTATYRMNAQEREAMSKMTGAKPLPRKEMLELAAIAFPELTEEQRTEMVDDMLSEKYPPLQ